MKDGLWERASSKGDAPEQQTSTQTVSNEPPAYLRPFLTDIAKEAQAQYRSSSPQYFPGQTYVPASGATTQALDTIAARAAAGSPLQGAAGIQQLGTIQGDYLDPTNNPGFQGALDAAVRPVTQRFEDSVLPNISSLLSAAGRFGSNAQNELVGSATDAYLRNVGDIGSTMAFQNYANERGIQNLAAQNAPALAAADYNDPFQLLNVGQQREAYASLPLQEDIARFNFEQNLPAAKLNQFAGQIYGQNRGGTSTATATTPLYTGNSWMGPFGAVLGTAGVAGNLFGKGGANILNK